MCMYKIHFRDRLKDGGLLDDDEFPFHLVQKVPAWHIEGHIASCQDEHHLRYTPLVGRTHGEGVETIWAEMNGFQYATREMSFGHRRDTLTDIFNSHNWTKLSKEGTYFRCKLSRRATPAYRSNCSRSTHESLS